MVILRRLLEAVLAGRQEPSRPASRAAEGYQWRCPCGARGQGFRDNQFDVECNADQHRLRQPAWHPLPYVVNERGIAVSAAVRSPSGVVGRHWGWSD